MITSKLKNEKYSFSNSSNLLEIVQFSIGMKFDALKAPSISLNIKI